MKKTIIPLREIKRNQFKTQIPAPLIEMANQLAVKYDVKSGVIIHTSGELIAGELECQAAEKRGETEIEALVWDIPDTLVFGAQLLYGGRDLKYCSGFPIADKAMLYFSFKNNGHGAELRREIDADDDSLAEFVAKLLGTNRTDLYRWLNIGRKDRLDLLKFVDEGEVNLLEAERMANSKQPKAKVNDPGDDEAASGDNSNQRASELVNDVSKFTKVDIVERVEDLRPEELEALRVKLMQFLSSLKEGDELPNGGYIERVYTHVPKNSTGKSRVDHLMVAFADGGTKIQITIHYPDLA